MKVRGIVALSVLAALAVVAVACGGAEAEVKVDKGLAAYAGANPASVEADAGQAARSSASGASASQVSYGEQLGAPAARSAVAPSGMGGDGMASAVSSAYPKTAGGATLAPLEQAGPLGIVVQGYGRATAPADTARVGFVVGRSGDIYPEPLPMEPGVIPESGVQSGSAEGGAVAGGVAPSKPDIYPTPVPSEPITEADLQPLVDAIKAQGVSDTDIEVTIYPATYYGPYGTPTARVTVTLHDVSKVGSLIDAGNQAVAESGSLYMQNVGVTYSVNNCDALLTEARSAAVEDARDNGAGLAEALGVGLGAIQGATEYNWDPYGYSGCQSQSGGPVMYEYEGPAYDPSVPAEVQIISNVTISFAMQ
jgi:uncharacterized protein YggE